jgi:hypothetical protein
MATRPEVEVHEDLYVSPATVEWLERQIAGEVRARFKTRVMWPLAGVLVASILGLVLFWIPAELPRVLGEDEMVRASIEKTTSELLADGRRGAALVREVLPGLLHEDPDVRDTVVNATRRYLGEGEARSRVVEAAAAAVGDAVVQQALREFLASDDGRTLLRSSIEGSVDRFFVGDVGRQVVSRAVEQVVESDGVRSILVSAVNRALQPPTMERR